MTYPNPKAIEIFGQACTSADAVSTILMWLRATNKKLWTKAVFELPNFIDNSVGYLEWLRNLKGISPAYTYVGWHVDQVGIFPDWVSVRSAIKDGLLRYYRQEEKKTGLTYTLSGTGHVTIWRTFASGRTEILWEGHRR